MFRVEGRRLGRPVAVTWTDGALVGDEPTVMAALDLVRARAVVGLEPVGPWARAELVPAWRALLVVRAVLDATPAPVVTADDGEELDVPDADLPDGAIA